MQCPVCDERLREVERHGVTIDICPSCKGVWLDRGELEKVAGMEARGDFDRDNDRREGRSDDRGSDRREGRFDDRDDDRREGRSDDRDDDYSRGRPRKRRGSFLSDLMEGFGE